ncbi:MAG: glycosyltransferase [Deltaproteobacteria bacterium]|nr:glycosyltransferase [Deltaproteobacteria bacterium]
MPKDGKIAVIVGTLDIPRILLTLQPLASRFSLTLFVLEGAKIPDSISKFCEVRIYQHVEDMPGFMRGLEKEAAHYDLLLGLEGARLSTYQALQLSKRFAKPLVIFSSETKPLKDEQFKNVQSLQKDLFKNTDLFLVPCQKSKNHLLFQGVSADRIANVPLLVDRERFSPQSGSKGKFRRYIGVGEDDFVVLFYDDLEANPAPEALLRSLVLMRQKNADLAARIKVIFAGCGADEKTLKYMAYDWGVGDAVYFIHQEIDGFCEDVFLASDALLCAPGHDKDRLPRLPFEVLEAMACGVIPVVVPSSSVKDLVGDYGMLADDLSPTSLAFVLFQLAGDRSFLLEKREVLRRASFLGEGGEWVDRIGKLLSVLKRRAGENDENVRNFVVQIQGDQVSSILKQAGVDEFMKAHELTDKQRGLLLRTKADILHQNGELEEAIGAFESAIICDEKNVDAYVGLGTIALSSFAQEEAVTFFRKAISFDPGNAKAALGLGLVFFRAGLASDSLYWLERSLLSGVANSTLPLNTISRICREAKDIEWALGALEKIIENVGEQDLLMHSLRDLRLRNG